MTNILTVNKLNVAVGNLNAFNVSVGNTSQTLLNTSMPIALKNNPTFAGAVGSSVSVEGLSNVIVVDRQENSTLSYSEAVNKYQIKQLTLDGGSF
jgi:hypothetical protein